jgi:hypothetical protein
MLRHAAEPHRHRLCMLQTKTSKRHNMKPPFKIKAFFELIGLCSWATIVVLFYLTILLLKLSPFILALVVTIWFISQVI